jgi:hypothetical protein
MNGYAFHCAGPVRRETLLLGAWLATPFGSQFRIEEKEILWVRDDRASLALFWDNQPFDDISVYGSLDIAIKTAQEKTARLRLTEADRLEVRVAAEVCELPARPSTRKHSGSIPEYVRLQDCYTGPREQLACVEFWKYPNDWRRGDWHPADLKLDQRTLAEAVIWSSHWSEAQNAAAREAFEAPFRVTEE